MFDPHVRHRYYNRYLLNRNKCLHRIPIFVIELLFGEILYFVIV